MDVKRLNVKQIRRMEMMKIDEDELYSFARGYFNEHVLKKVRWNIRQIHNAL